MNDALRPVAYLGGLAALFAGALGAGTLIGGGDESRAQPPAAHGDAMAGMADEGSAAGHDGDAAGHASANGAASGLAVAANGLRLVAPSSARAGATERFAFRVVDGDGATVRDFDVQHTKRLHLIAVRRDLTGFQHLHPRQDASGGWSTPLTLRDAGAYRVFADVKPAGGDTVALASDVLVGGDFRPRPLPAPTRATRVDGYDVALSASPARDGETTLTYTITRDGAPVAVEPYLGASGHLVALRAGDLAYLHVHPLADADRGQIAFAAHYPSGGRYRLFLQFKAAGRVHTAALTQEAGEA
ncbi:hypothetical protein DSM104299_01441 [Baekduia alba]|uniref:hypothetical protein n=1 Tax=Baekduia alba TaxID=2997333 RepID=UPI002341EFDB|nr:hypothetical protein [Baekduia alba]WCB92742.1 hypothetical protein DSM104299_01441 [Baekduia alba]